MVWVGLDSRWAHPSDGAGAPRGAACVLDSCRAACPAASRAVRHAPAHPSPALSPPRRQCRFAALTNPCPVCVCQSPLFLLFLDATWQLLEQYPTAFEFSETYLAVLGDSTRIALFGTFLFNCPHQRVRQSTVSRADRLHLGSVARGAVVVTV